MNNENKTNLRLEEIRSNEFKEIQIEAYKKDLNRLHKRLSEFVDVACPACMGEDKIYRFQKYKCKFVECQSCETLYMTPRPSPEIMEDYYSNSENYYIWNKYIYPKSEAIRREKICRPNLISIIDVCEREKMEKPSIIEIGPGFGTFSKLAQESEYFSKVSVIERTPSMADACRKRDLHVIESALEDVILDTIEESDVLVCFEVIEHIYNPTDFLIRVAKLLRSGGLFIFTCPNGKGFDTEILQAQSPSVDTEHVNLFNPKSIEILLNNVDFEIVSVETPGRLDVEIVNRAIIENGLEIVDNPFWRSLFGEKYETMGDDFQKLLIKHKMSGNMRIIARKK